MRFLLITSSFPRDSSDSRNAGVFVEQLAELFSAGGDDVTVLTPQQTRGERPYRVESFAWFGDEASLSHLDPRRPATLVRFATLLLSGMWRGWRARRRDSPDVVVALWAVPSGIVAYALHLLTGQPYVVWALGSDIWRIDDYPFGRWMLRRILRAADHLYADGVELAHDVTEIAKRDCDFLPTSRRLPPPQPALDGPDDDRIRIFCVGRYHPHKGIDVLLDAVSELDEETRARIVVTIRGGGPQEDDLRDQLDRCALGDVVTLGGFIDAQGLSDQLAATDLAIIPSRLESIPLVLSDYAQTDTPMIVTDTGDLGSLTREHDAGRVVRADDAYRARRRHQRSSPVGTQRHERGARRAGQAPGSGALRRHPSGGLSVTARARPQGRGDPRDRPSLPPGAVAAEHPTRRGRRPS